MAASAANVVTSTSGSETGARLKSTSRSVAVSGSGSKAAAASGESAVEASGSQREVGTASTRSGSVTESSSKVMFAHVKWKTRNNLVFTCFQRDVPFASTPKDLEIMQAAHEQFEHSKTLKKYAISCCNFRNKYSTEL